MKDLHHSSTLSLSLSLSGVRTRNLHSGEGRVRSLDSANAPTPSEQNRQGEQSS